MHEIQNSESQENSADLPRIYGWDDPPTYTGLFCQEKQEITLNRREDHTVINVTEASSLSHLSFFNEPSSRQPSTENNEETQNENSVLCMSLLSCLFVVFVFV